MASDGLIAELGQLVSEGRNPRTIDIDLMSTIDVLTCINREDAEVARAVNAVLPDIAAAVDRIVDAFRSGGRLIYIGAGTSGRLGVLDASECPPTFGVPATMVVGIIAGGDHALRHSVEGAEDDAGQAGIDLAAHNLADNDVVVGIAVSGRTPYVIGALDYATSIGATTIALSCNPGSAIAKMADIAISPVVGPEVVAGSTRMKSGTAQKLVLNMLTTASMIRIGKTYQNLMVDMALSNEKLIGRAVRMVAEATGRGAGEAERLLDQSGNDVKLAILMGVTGLSKSKAEADLRQANGILRRAVGTQPAE